MMMNSSLQVDSQNHTSRHSIVTRGVTLSVLCLSVLFLFFVSAFVVNKRIYYDTVTALQWWEKGDKSRSRWINKLFLSNSDIGDYSRAKSCM